jgi:hypothetical protein
MVIILSILFSVFLHIHSPLVCNLKIWAIFHCPLVFSPVLNTLFNLCNVSISSLSINFIGFHHFIPLNDTTDPDVVLFKNISWIK